MSKETFDEKQPVSPSSTSPAAANTFNSEYDLEAVKLNRKPTFFERMSIGSQSQFKDAPPETSLEQCRQAAAIAVEEIEGTDTRILEECPNGYPRLASFLSSEGSFSLYRGFDYLHSRLLLELQDDIVALEKELDNLDQVDGEDITGKRRLKNRGFDSKRSRNEDGFRSRKAILDEIRIKLLEYDELLIKARDLQAFHKPSKRDYRSVRTFFWNTKPLTGPEASYIRKKEDIVTLRTGREWSSFDGMIENMLRRCNSNLIRKVFSTRELREKTSDQDVHYYSASRVERFVGIIITTIIFVLLVLPVVLMYKLTTMGQSELENTHGTFKAIGVLVIFTLLFSAAMSLLTKARRHEIFAAAAGYCAVLVVFISNFSGSSSSSGSGG